ncbi:MAG TPA: GAF domain-containing sensor histidine kinase [Nocardioidaceae bacterium]|nr:GAF domain-containing sensor histidine kinase [Nocardioidaceae bacterium]
MTHADAMHDLVLAAGDVDLAAAARLFTEMLDADGVVVFLVDAEGRQLEVGAAYPPPESEERALRIPVGYGVTGLVALNGRPVMLDEDSPRNAAHRRLLGLDPEETVSRLCVPARAMGGPIVAVVAAHRRRPEPFTGDDLARSQRCADLLGLRLYAQGLLGAAEEHRTERDELIAQAISAQEAERRRIAGDLHDGVTQALASLAFHLSAADVGLTAIEPSNPAVAVPKAQIQEARRLAGLAYDETRAAISGLHSLLLDDLGLVSALESLTQNVPQLEIEFRGDPADVIGEVPDHWAAVLYRIAQEAVNNAVKHSGASHAVLSLRRVGDSLVLGVTDDGVGFDAERVRAQAGTTALGEHYGLSAIAERCALIGATLRIDSAEDRGTAVMVELPLR